MTKKTFDSKTSSMNTLNSIFFYYTLFFLLFQYQIPSISAYRITPSTPLKDGQNLTSISGTFALGFFSPSSKSQNRYVGMWYKTISLQTIVWVANRDSPVNDSSGVLTISSTGNLVIQDGANHTVWSTNVTKVVANPVVEFLESGNLVLRDENSDEYLWQSFDYPCDTVIPGMEIGLNLTTGENKYLRAWKSSDDPSSGDFTYGVELSGYSKVNQSIQWIIRHGTVEYYRSGPWNGLRNSGSPELKPNGIFEIVSTINANEVRFTFRLLNQSVISRLHLRQDGNSGSLERHTWVQQTKSWVLHVPIPRDRCDTYALCGPSGICDTSSVPYCQCLGGFNPKSPKDWNDMDWSGGCVRSTPLDCAKDGFRKFTAVKLPETATSWMNMSMNLEQCGAMCSKNCSCLAYTNPDIRDGGKGCLMWFDGLIDIKQMATGSGQDLYIRMAASDLESKAHSKKMKRLIVILIVTLLGVLVVFGCLAALCISRKKKGYWFLKTLKPKVGRVKEDGKEDLDLPLFDLDTITTATDYFSQQNKLGEGGFGSVYKGNLNGGQEIAVKRLSKKSAQGPDEFKNEVILISKVQHRNLVKLLGCCIQDEEKVLIYEYMPNGSLDYYLFDRSRSKLLDWQKRFNIILGIARGLLYLHHDSRLRIIHRDLKASNILLDSALDPKISDFGMARMFGGDQTEASTNRIVGTHGYMSPEYAVDGHFSVKSDVFSFGVLVLEILSGKRNRGFFHQDHQLNLLGHAWRLWSEDKAVELVDESIRASLVEEEVFRCIRTGLLCVQQNQQERPTMSSVLLMLSTDSIHLSQPQPPGFYIERNPIKPNISYSDEVSINSNDATFTAIEGR